MPLYLTQSHSSRITKPSASLKRSSSAPLANAKRTKSLTRTSSLAKVFDEDTDSEDDEGNLLAGTGKVVPNFNVTSVRDVASAVQYATRTMFSAIPERAGMNSTRIAEVLNFHKSLPPIVSLSHIHAIVSASSKSEREIQSLLSTGKLRKLKVAGRGNDMSGLSEVFMLTRDHEEALTNSGLSSDIVIAFINLLRANPRASSILAHDLSPSHSTILARSGFLVSSSMSGSRNLSLAGSSLVGMPTISRAASGTTAAVGGDAAFERLGGVGSAKRSKSEPEIASQTGELAISMPNIGPFLRLLNAGRAHLLELLRTFKHKQAPLYLLRERWDGAIDSDSRVSTAKRLRGEFSDVMPAKTKKWRVLNGLNFDWALEECLGAGMIELFETHSVGLGVRALT